jgi:hypothetical protein
MVGGSRHTAATIALKANWTVPGTINVRNTQERGEAEDSYSGFEARIYTQRMMACPDEARQSDTADAHPGHIGREQHGQRHRG